MRILINASNLKIGGGVQVADSVIRELYKYEQHTFIVVYSSALTSMAEDNVASNLELIHYDMPSSITGMFYGKNHFLDDLVEKKKIDAVLTIFGPSRWIPKVRHISGFAISHLLIPESPYWQLEETKHNLKQKVKMYFLRRQFAKDSNEYFTENTFISDRLLQLYPKKKVYTISNTYNQVFDEQERWKDTVHLNQDNVFKLLTIASYYPHKNLNIIPAIIDILQENHPSFHFQFVVSVDEKLFWSQNRHTKKRASVIKFLGKVPIEQCPMLYKQTDAMFLPTLLECFSASYAEAMKMERPILTSDLGFARSICEKAAVYFNPIDANDIAEKIYQLASNKEMQDDLVTKGKERLQTFDCAEKRVQKLMAILTN